MTRRSELWLSVTRDDRQSGADGRYESFVPRDESGEQRLLNALLFQIIGRNLWYCTVDTVYPQLVEKTRYPGVPCRAQ